MCGIVGFTGGKGGAAQIVYEGLKRLEYRGYDSAGIAVTCGGAISVVKKRGRVGGLEKELAGLCGCTGIGHTRWATHGEPSDINAHPHSSGAFTLVHNGIIENFAELKEKYFPHEAFASETDSEVVVRLIDKFYEGDLLLTVKRVADILKGSYALAVICAGFEGIVAVKYKSPAVIGYGADGSYIASDCPALAGLCERISVLEDGDIAVLTPSGVKLYASDLSPVKRAKKRNLSAAAALDLCGFPHYMLKEINEDASAVAATVKAFSSVKRSLKQALSGVNRIIITGCGTAYNSGLVAKRYIECFARIPAEAETAGELRYKNPVIDDRTAVLAVSQSGETADTVEAASLCKSSGARVIAVTNAPYSALTRIADVVVPVEAGPEICVAATKSYSGQLAALYMTACLIAHRNASDIKELPALIKSTVEHTDIEALAQICARANGVYFLGRGLDYDVAVEGSLKLKEITYIQSEGYPAGELKHGTLALIDKDKVAVVIITDEKLAAKSENAAEQVLSRHGTVAVITNVADCAARLGKRVPVITLPECPAALSPLLSAAVVQLLAYRTAVSLNRDPDKPRNLAKSVTVE